MKRFWGRFGCLGMVISAGLMGFAWANTLSTEGIAFQSTRVIYPQSAAQGMTFRVSNDTSSLYLLQSWVDPWLPGVYEAVATPAGATEEIPVSAAPFIVTPPLERMEVGQATTLRIRLTQKPPVTDRESVYALQLKAIPNQPVEREAPKPKDGVQMAFAIQNTVKLFYRPEGLPDYDGQAVAKGLQFARQGASVVVTNPSAFYVTFNTLSVDGKAVDDNTLFNMVPPKGTQRYPLPAGVAAGQVEWTIINDHGGKTDVLTRSLTRSGQSE